MEHIWEEHIYTTPGKMLRRNFVCKPNEEKHMLGWPAHLQHSSAARVDQKGNCGDNPENDDLWQAARVKSSVWWPAVAGKPLWHVAKLWVVCLFLETPENVHDMRQPCQRGMKFKSTKACIASLINTWCGAKFLNEWFLGSWFQALILQVRLQFWSGLSIFGSCF